MSAPAEVIAASRVAVQGIASPDRGKERIRYPQTLFIAAHGYQPPRFGMGVFSGERVPVFPETNDRIHKECYRPVLADGKNEQPRPFPDGFVTSFYGTTREWMKGAYPWDFAKIQERVRVTPDVEYKILGDPYLHPIMPFLSEQNQDMVIKIGKKAFEEDFGVSPKGAWLPETAVDYRTMRALFNNGYEFVVLHGHQLQSTEKNPMRVPIRKGDQVIGHMAVLHVDSGLSGAYSYQGDLTSNADEFLRRPEFRGRSIAVASDLELYGHHKPYRDMFLDRVTDPDALASAGFSALDVKEEVKNAISNPNAATTEVWDNSSWSCFHGLGRWKGADYCPCAGEHDPAKGHKQYLRHEVDTVGAEIDARLDVIDPNWRQSFIPFFLRTRRSMFSDGDLRKDITESKKDIPLMENPEVGKLFSANLARLTANTSCAWFFSGQRAEHRFAELHIQEAKQLMNLTAQKAVAA